MIAAITMTMITSRSVKPRCRFAMNPARKTASVAVHDVAVLALAAFPAVGAERDQVEGPALPGHGVLVVIAPCVLQVRVLGVRPGPLLDAGRLPYQRLQVVGVFPHLELVELDLVPELLHADHGLLRLGLGHLLPDLGGHERHEPRDQDEHDDDLHQREAVLAAECGLPVHESPLFQFAISYTQSTPQRLPFIINPTLTPTPTTLPPL